MEFFYKLLATGEVVSYESILTEYDGGVLSTPKITAHNQYNTLKKIVPEVIDTFVTYGLPVVSISEGRNTHYQYIGSNKNPLKNIRFKALLNERYNILSECIVKSTPVRVTYRPFDRGKMDIIFHPHLLRTFNGRFFAFGVSEMEGKTPFRKFCMALDRIDGDIRGSSATYLSTFKDEYKFLVHTVGVRFEEGTELTTIRLRAHDKYTFGRITTKPLHDSQIVVEYPNWEEGRETGDVEIQVYPNVELVGKILSYGNLLEVISPKKFRNRVQNEAKLIRNRYDTP